MAHEKPILFSGPMVQALLAGRKTMFREVIKPQPPYDCGKLYGPEWYEPAITDRNGDLQPGKPIFGVYDKYGDYGVKCPYQPGQVLWVRETWAKISDWTYCDPNLGMPDDYIYKELWPEKAEHPRWRSPATMPREAARLFLVVKSVRVERVQDITEEDAKAEGVDPLADACYANNGWGPTFHDPDSGGSPILRDGFKDRWASLNAKREGGLYAWGKNPWVFVNRFERKDAP